MNSAIFKSFGFCIAWITFDIVIPVCNNPALQIMNIIYRIDIFDLEAYNQQIRNNVNITAIPSFTGDMISTSSTDLNNEGDYKLPLFPHFYFLYNGELIKAHEREISRRLPKKDKEVNRKYRTVIEMKGFSWTNNESLSQLLRAITVKE